jgi:hypothetical protein
MTIFLNSFDLCLLEPLLLNLEQPLVFIKLSLLFLLGFECTLHRNRLRPLQRRRVDCRRISWRLERVLALFGTLRKLRPTPQLVLLVAGVCIAPAHIVSGKFF